MVDSTAAAVLFPLLFVVILQLCEVARSIDLSAASESGHWGSDPDGTGTAGTVRPFTLIHGVNYVALLYIYAGVTDAYDGSYVVGALTLDPGGLYFYLGVVVLFLWLFLPLFEVRRYHAVTETSVLSVPRSLWIHVGAVLATAAVIRLSSRLRAVRPQATDLGAFSRAMVQFSGSSPDVVVADVGVTVALLVLLSAGILGFCTRVCEEAETMGHETGAERRTNR